MSWCRDRHSGYFKTETPKHGHDIIMFITAVQPVGSLLPCLQIITKTRNLNYVITCKKFKNGYNVTCCRISNRWWWSFPVAYDMHKKLIACSRHEWRHIMWSTSDRYSWPLICYSEFVVHECVIDNVCLSNRPRYLHTCLRDVGDICYWRGIGIYTNIVTFTGWTKKLDHFWELITLRQLVIERYIIYQKFANFVQKKRFKSCMSLHLSILC